MRDADSVDLDALYDHLSASATEAGLLVVPGMVVVDEEHAPLWQWSGEPGTEDAFFAIATRVDARLVYAHRSVLDLDALLRQELAASYLTDEDEEDEEDDEGLDFLRQLKVSLRRWNQHDRQTYAISFGFFHQGVDHLLLVDSAWFEELGAEITQRIAELKEQRNQAYRDETSRKEAKAREQAATLAHHERYAGARNDHQRQMVAQEVFPELNRLEIRDLLERAKYIFQDEVAPQIEQKLADRAKALQDAGDSVPTIAAKLGVSKERVQRLLYLAQHGG